MNFFLKFDKSLVNSKDPKQDPDPFFRIYGFGSGRQLNYGSGSGSGSAAVVSSHNNQLLFHRKIKILLLVPGVHCQARGRRNIEVPWTKSKKFFQELFLHDSFEQFDVAQQHFLRCTSVPVLYTSYSAVVLAR